MKKSILKLVGIIALIALIGFSMAACEIVDDAGGGGGANPFNATSWTGIDEDGDDVIITFTGSTFSVSYPDYPDEGFDGAYTNNGNTATLRFYGETGSAVISGNSLRLTLPWEVITLTKTGGDSENDGANPFNGTSWTGIDEDGDDIIVSFDSSNTFSVSYPDYPDEGFDGTYTNDGNTATLRFHGETGSAVITGNTLQVDLFGEEITLTKIGGGDNEDDDDENDGSNPFSGTSWSYWEDGYKIFTLSFTGNDWTLYLFGDFVDGSSYTYNGNTAYLDYSGDDTAVILGNTLRLTLDGDTLDFTKD